jgi:hypothetical protein
VTIVSDHVTSFKVTVPIVDATSHAPVHAAASTWQTRRLPAGCQV